jgi:antitoxin component YwqK of YwqJK toxin-antitoxin module
MDTPAMANATEPEPHIERYANGTVKMTGFHLDGEMHGDWQFFRLDGSLMRVGAFDGGRQVGPWRTFDRTGRVVKETDFGDAATD